MIDPPSNPDKMPPAFTTDAGRPTETPAIQEILCPVCRAKQPPQPACRRCSADLSLYVKALRSVNAVRTQLDTAVENGNPEIASQASRYLKWLSPKSTISSP
jgi:hypothetical protein